MMSSLREIEVAAACPPLSEKRLLLEWLTNEVWLSHASVWEMQIKVQLGKLRLNAPLASLIDKEIRGNHLHLLPIAYDDILKLAELPHHHRDPFDRMI